MKKPGQTILVDIDETLDQLIRNADAVNRIADRRRFTDEIKAMHKTQDSLIARLMHMHEVYENEKAKVEKREEKSQLSRIETKLTRFGKLNARMIATLENGAKKQAKVRVSARRRGSKAH